MKVALHSKSLMHFKEATVCHGGYFLVSNENALGLVTREGRSFLMEGYFFVKEFFLESFLDSTVTLI
jgi:hypothetical protein